MEINWIFHTYPCNSVRDIVESEKTGFPTTICGSTVGAASDGKVVKTKLLNNLIVLGPEYF